MNVNLGPWAYARLPASWRGIPFLVRESDIKRGRRIAVHEYPMRDVVWVEDLGRATRYTSFRGFVVGDDVDAQLQALIKAAEQAGEGTLVHPALGTVTGSLIEFAARDTAEQGRVWALDFVFVSSSERVFPGTADDTQGQVDDAADDADDAIDGDFGAALSGGLASGLQTAAQTASAVVSTVGHYASLAQGAVADVTAVGNAAAGLAGNFGRFSLGARLSTVPGLGSATQAVQAANAAAAQVGTLAQASTRLAGLLS